MSTLRFKELEPKRGGRTKPLLTILGIGALVGALALGTTFAANITLSSDNNVEFGQGVVTTAACDGSINVNPVSSFVNASATPAARFNLSSIAFTGIDTSTLAGGTSTTEGCAGKTLTIKAYGETGNALTLVTGVTSVDVVVSATGTNFTESTNNVSITSQNQTSFTLTLDSLYSPIAADQVYKITIESKDSVVAVPVSYAVGDTGPSGGIIFYVAESPFECGPTLDEVCQYLEAAPNGWSGREPTEEDPRITWAAVGNQSTSVAGAVGTSIGTGYQNSIAIANQAGNDATNSAAVLAMEYAGGGAEDWYLPSSDELRELWKIRNTPHNILPHFSYWSSTQNAGAAGQAWDSGGAEPVPYGQKSSTTMVRPIRAFSGSLT